MKAAGPLRSGPAELRFDYRLEEHIALSGPTPRRHVERWVVSVLVDRPAAGEGRLEIGYAHVIVFHLEPGRDIRDLADRASGTWLDVEGTSSTASTWAGKLHTDREHEPGTHVLLLDRVWLRRDYRGRGLGPIIAAAVIDRLGRGCHLAACYPAPFEGTRQPEERDRAIEALGKLWAKVGFRHWRDGVWMFNPSEHDTHAALLALLAARTADVPQHDETLTPPNDQAVEPPALRRDEPRARRGRSREHRARS